MLEDLRNIGSDYAGKAFETWCDAKKSGMSEEALDGLLVGISSFIGKSHDEPEVITQYEIDLDAFMDIHDSSQAVKGQS